MPGNHQEDLRKVWSTIPRPPSSRKFHGKKGQITNGQKMSLAGKMASP